MDTEADSLNNLSFNYLRGGNEVILNEFTYISGVFARYLLNLK